ncbi:MAG: hypothetical protein QGI89_01135 [Candidatus Woesearchaeota archaeon]|nr:hypothetical protein [Parcubacteria group bacterium]MDP6138690.1 hypothetical protein [Candidatus Woesearchaeota archaeon]MDP6265492.1 hypothetical protein [Candidatus Woesearchaeota archaeon]
MLQNLSKREWFNSKLRKNFLVFDKNQFPKFMDTSYDPTIFAVINAAYILKDKLDDFFKVVEPLIVFDKNKNTFKIDNLQSEKIKEMLFHDKMLSGLTLFEFNPKGTEHLDFLRQLGAEISDQTEHIPAAGSDVIKLKNWKSYFNKKYDITFSNGLMDENSSIKYEKHTAVFSGLELYTLFANITKKTGFSIHSNGSIISSLYETFFQFIGFNVIEYFRTNDENFKFTMIMQKINKKETNFDEFFYIYHELKKRWPTRYGN